MAAKKDSRNSWSCTEYKISEVRHIWTIRRFVFCQAKTGTSLTSFEFGPVDGPKWSLKLYPNGCRELDKEFLSLYLKLSSPSETEAFPEVEYSLTLLNDAEREVIFPRNVAFTFKKFAKGETHGNSQFIRRSTLDKLLKRSPLKICCKIHICLGKVDTSGSLLNDCSEEHIFQLPKSTMFNDMKSMLIDQVFGDTIIQVEDKKFLVYRGILQARSPVFAAMFQHAMEEQKKNRIIITDIEPKVVEEMLFYIYTDRSPNIKTMADDLLPVADKYNLERLKVMSEEVISRKITKENVIETLIFADRHTANQLKAAAINFIIANSHYYVDVSNWKNVTLSLSMHPDLMLQVTTSLFASKK